MTERTYTYKPLRVWANGRPRVISAAILRARARLGMTQKTLALRAGISCSALNAIERCQNRDLRVGTLVAIVDALAVTPDELLGYGQSAV